MIHDELIITPVGFRPRSLVSLAGGEVATDTKLRNGESRAFDLGSKWIVYAVWNNNTGEPITRFETTWEVPPEPRTKNNQRLFLFNGIQNSNMIYQPVLQWGRTAAGGGNFWAISSWYAGGPGTPSKYSTLIPVQSGQSLTGVIEMTGRQGNRFNYNCEFDGIPNSALAIEDIEELKLCTIALEAFGMQVCSDYPDTDKTTMRSIGIKTGNTERRINWNAFDRVTDCGQHSEVVTDAQGNEEIELRYSGVIV